MTPWRPHSVLPASRLSIPYAVPPFEAEFQIQVLSDQVLDVYVRDNPMMEQGETLGVSVGVMQHDLLMRFHPFVRVWYLLIQNSGTVEAHIQYLVKWGKT